MMIEIWLLNYGAVYLVCQGTQTIPQIAVLHSEHHLYSQPVNNLHWGYDTSGVQGAVFSLLEHSYGVDILDEWAPASRIAEFPVVVAPEQDKMSDAMVATLKRYVAQGGRLLVTGAAAVDRFGKKFLGVKKVKREGEKCCFIPSGDGNYAVFSKTWALIEPVTARSLGRLGLSCLTDGKLTRYAAAVVNRVGRGLVAYAPFDLFRDFKYNRYPPARVFIGELIEALKPEMAIRVSAPVCVDVVLRRKGRAAVIHLINRGSGIPQNPDSGAVDAIPDSAPVTIRMQVGARPKQVRAVLENTRITWRFKPGRSTRGGGEVTIAVPRIAIHAAVTVE
ncbi:MAG: hypothetical protein ABIF71_06755 [Planctomycetota bacterium]